MKLYLGILTVLILVLFWTNLTTWQEVNNLEDRIASNNTVVNANSEFIQKEIIGLQAKKSVNKIQIVIPLLGPSLEPKTEPDETPMLKDDTYDNAWVGPASDKFRGLEGTYVR